MDIITEAEKLQKALAEIEQRRSNLLGTDEAENLDRLQRFLSLALDEIWTELLAGIGEPVRCKRPAFRRS